MNELNITTEYGTVNNANGGTNMNKSEFIRAFVAANPKPDQSYCPQCWQYWSNSKGEEICWDNVSGRRQSGHPVRSWHDDYFIATPRKQYDGAYFKFHPQYNMFEVAIIVLKVNGRGVDRVPVDWQFVDRAFAFKGEIEAYDQYGYPLTNGKFYSKGFEKFIHNLTYSNYHMCHKKVVDVLNEMGGDITDTSMYSWRVKDWYKRNWVTRSISQKRLTLDDYNDLEMPDFKGIPEDKHQVIAVGILDDQYCVLRRFSQKQHYDYHSSSYNYDDEWKEDVRVFIDAKGKPSVMMKDYGSPTWKITARQIDRWYSNPKCIMIGDSVEDWLPLKYIKATINWEDSSCLKNVVAILRHPIIEMLSKSGYPNLAKELCMDNAIAANLKAYFYVKERKQPIYEMLQVNKWILKAAEEVAAGVTNSWRAATGLIIIRDLKRLYGASEYNADIRHLSKETVEAAVNGLKQLEYGTFKELLGFTGWQYRRTNWFDIDDSTRRFVEKMFRLNSKTDNDLIRMYIDVRRLFDQLDNNHRPNIDIKDFDDAHGLEIIHNGLVALKTEQDRERRAYYDAQEKERQLMRQKKFEKLQEERIKKFEREGDEYCIRVPHAPEEITREGCALHHCVGGYVDRHCLGETNIIFLRKKEDKDMPFYTIEVQGNTVIQIHGSHNKWLGNDPSAIPFVWKWIQDLGLNCEKRLLLNLGAGYSSSKEQLDESYLTKS